MQGLPGAYRDALRAFIQPNCGVLRELPPPPD
jgi:hypothetical protein